MFAISMHLWTIMTAYKLLYTQLMTALKPTMC